MSARAANASLHPAGAEEPEADPPQAVATDPAVVDTQRDTVYGDLVQDAPYARWAAAHAQGIAAAQSRTQAKRRASQLPRETLAAVKRRTRELHPCKIKGCKRTAYKGSLCRTHWKLVPVEDVVALQVACMTASRDVAAKFHRRFLRDVQQKVAA